MSAGMVFCLSDKELFCCAGYMIFVKKKTYSYFMGNSMLMYPANLHGFPHAPYRYF